MTITDTDVESTRTTTLTALLGVRIPDGSGADLATGAERRLGRVAGVRTVTVDGLCGLDPQFTATLVTVAVTLESTAAVPELRERLADAVSVERVDRLAAVE
ncbi:hypothetical protein [Halorientalis pallida]|uniref:Uncharacterized protein n=1 Tax=Halorientalis pallida TaxID=2479928 RepID=A0A498KVZ9_9EURY|nr:hypothetical protein [Halorientalis pallida]RXK49387.1 hypothetical protein EAF64_10770 [Halorientalis pallida]